MAKNIYIIDDDRDIVESTKIILEASGYNIKTAYTIEDGKSLVDDNLPDLIILDVMFPGNQSAGFDFCRDMRSNDKTKNIPIVMFTAVNRKFPFKHGVEDDWLPADEFLDKPVDPANLLTIVKKLT